MTDWIEQIIHPPGIQKENRFSLFATIGEIGNRVRADALKAFNAHFPYLADEAKLEEHGKALLVPHLLHDTKEEYRNRVSTASFFLMRAGERAYIMEQLREHFGAAFKTVENFLSIHTKVVDLNDTERMWVLGLFDSLLNPNVYIELSDWFHYAENIVVNDTALYTFDRRDLDLFDDKLYRNGRILRDGRTVLNAKMKTSRNGFLKRNEGVMRNGYFILPDTDIVRHPVRRLSGIHDTLNMVFRKEMTDWQQAKLPRNGLLRRNGEMMRRGWIAGGFDPIPPLSFRSYTEERIPLSDSFVGIMRNDTGEVFRSTRKRNGEYWRNGTVRRSNYVCDVFSSICNCATNFQDTALTADVFIIGMRKYHFHNGNYQRNGIISRNSMLLLPLA